MISKARRHMFGEAFDVIAATRSRPSRDRRRNTSIPAIPDSMTKAARPVKATAQHNPHTGQEQQHMKDLIPLSTLSELGSVDQLTHQLGDDVRIDDIGRRCCTRERARQLFEARDAQQAEQQRRHAEFMQRMDELSRRNRAQLRGGIPAAPGGTALFDMLGVDEK